MDRRKTHNQRLSWWGPETPGDAWCRIDLKNARISDKPTCKRCIVSNERTSKMLGQFFTALK